MNSSLMTDPVKSTSLGAEFDDLLQLCKDADKPRAEIGQSLRLLVSDEYEIQFKDSAEYWLLRTIACELYQPRNAWSFVKKGLDKAYACPDASIFATDYAKLRIKLLEGRVNRSGASISDGLRQLYELRLHHAKDSPYASVA